MSKSPLFNEPYETLTHDGYRIRDEFRAFLLQFLEKNLKNHSSRELESLIFDEPGITISELRVEYA